MTGVNEHTLYLSNRSRLKETVSMKNKNKEYMKHFLVIIKHPIINIITFNCVPNHLIIYK